MERCVYCEVRNEFINIICTSLERTHLVNGTSLDSGAYADLLLRSRTVFVGFVSLLRQVDQQCCLPRLLKAILKMYGVNLGTCCVFAEQATMDFDEVLEEIGELGRYQITTYLLICLPVLFSAANSLTYVFTAGVPNYR